MEIAQFSWLDYTIFFGTLGLSAAVGLYFGFFGKKQDNTKEYIHGGKSLKILPIAASLIVSEVSGINILGVPSDIYANGSAYLLGVFSSLIMTAVTIYFFLPVLYQLQLPTVYDYLKLRFNNSVASISSFLFAFILTIYFPMVIYVPVVALHQVSGIQISIIVPIICLLCIFYTTVGGFRAVVWIDTLQMIIMTVSLLTVFALGMYVEGLENIFEKAGEGGRLDFNLNGDPTNNQASITVLLGLTVLLVSCGVNPMYTQRYLAVPTMRDAKIAAVLLGLGSIVIRVICSTTGLMIYTHYADCSPLATGAIKSLDSILPYYIMDISSFLPGLPGLFVAGLLSSALGSVSAGLNTMSGTIYINLLKPRLSKTTSEQRSSTIMKLIVIVLGICITLLVFLVQYLGALLELSITISGIAVGPVLALFTLGMLLPQMNTKGALVGAASSLLFLIWIASGAVYYAFKGYARSTHLPYPTDGCNISPNVTHLRSNVDEPMYLYRISYYYYSVVGFIATIIIAIPVSLLTGGLQQNVDPKLLCHFVRRFLKETPTISKQNEIDEPDVIVNIKE